MCGGLHQQLSFNCLTSVFLPQLLLVYFILCLHPIKLWQGKLWRVGGFWLSQFPHVRHPTISVNLDRIQGMCNWWVNTLCHELSPLKDLRTWMKQYLSRQKLSKARPLHMWRCTYSAMPNYTHMHARWHVSDWLPDTDLDRSTGSQSGWQQHGQVVM